MRLSFLQKLGAYSIIAGGFLSAAYAFCFTLLLPVQEPTKDFSKMVSHPNWIWVTSLALPGIILMVFGFTAVYSRIYEKSGWLGFTGYFFITTAYVFQAAQLVSEIFLYPIIAENASSVELLSKNIILNHPLNTVFSYGFQAIILLGVLLFGITLIRFKEFNKLGGILFLSGAVFYAAVSALSIFIGIAGIIMFSAGCTIIGLNLMKMKKQV
ncbi:MAG: hypothetical protein N3I35_06385 [Clostridia bacterium]|nr:hypothetical protein [Clostridia bacterium]